MKGERFIAEVKNLAELDSNEEAQKTVRATLETLREAGRQRAGRLGRPAPARDRSLRRGAGGREASPWRSSTSE
jgi:hypothetical protein